jgi:DNA repair protein RecN (Recombination protein N)
VIEHLDIRDLGVIAHASLPFGKGFTVLTGETGAGKTMVVTALGLLLGERAETARVRTGAESSWVEGRFLAGHIPSVSERVSELGGAIDENELVVSRQMSAEGRSRAVIGGRSAPISVLSEIAEQLVVVHGQSDQIRLKAESAQREALDRYAGETLRGVMAEYSRLFREHHERVAQLRDLEQNEATHLQEIQRLTQALAEIEAVRPEPGEDERLRQVSERLEHVEDLKQAAGVAKSSVSDDSGLDSTDARALIDQAIRSLERVVDRDEGLAPIVAGLRESLFQLDDQAAALSSYLSSLSEGDGVDLESIMQRRAAITALMRNYGPTLDDVLEFEKASSDRLLHIDVSADAKADLVARISADQGTLDQLAVHITQLRTRAAVELSEKVTEELRALAMADAHFTVEVSAKEQSLSGADKIEFLLAPHVGAPPRPVAKGASGGELSRVMLALEVVIAEADPVPTFIFDEVDSGVGGQTALEIGKRLARLAHSAQVICVTHLAQVASAADHHLQVVKDQSGEYTQSSVKVLEGEERLSEIARMLGGDQDSASAREHAKEMLERHSVSRGGVA